uniref:Uncharacterized protein n=1 Tax=Micrurus carvalhoi TaxID=3147026 RepID=A0A2H6N5X3_9SAUR
MDSVNATTVLGRLYLLEGHVSGEPCFAVNLLIAREDGNQLNRRQSKTFWILEKYMPALEIGGLSFRVKNKELFVWTINRHNVHTPLHPLLLLFTYSCFDKGKFQKTLSNQLEYFTQNFGIES